MAFHAGRFLFLFFLENVSELWKLIFFNGKVKTFPDFFEMHLSAENKA